MVINKAISVIKTFDSDKIKSFLLYLKSSYLNKRKTLIEIYELIISNPIESEEQIAKLESIILQKLEIQENNHSYFIKLMSFLYKELEQFIILEEIKNDSIYSEIRLLKYYNYHHLDNLYLETLRNIQKKLKNYPSASSIHFYVNENLCAYENKYDERKGDINYINTFESLIKFYQYHHLKLSCLMLNRELIVNFNYSDTIQRYSDIHIEEGFGDYIVQIYRKLFTLLKKEYSKSLFLEVQSDILTHIDKIDEEDVGITLSILSNLSKHIFKDKQEYYAILFNLYKIQIEHKTIFYESKIKLTMIKNIIVLSLYNGEYEWAIDFLNENKKHIIPEEKIDESYYYLLSEIYFAKKEFDKSLENLSKTKSTDNLIKLSIKRLYLKIFLEKEEVNSFDSFTNSYKVYLSRDESLTQEKKEAERNFVNNMILINRYKLSNNKKKLHSLLNKLDSENISDKNYLTELIRNSIE